MRSDEAATTTTTSSSTTWGSWEELLLACAVTRHGFKNWDSVAMEIQTKTSLPQLQTTAQCCKQKYQDLKLRFNNNHYNVDDNSNISWLEEQLRKARVDELKQEVQRYDLSILSLQLKVKRLEEEGGNTIHIIQRKPDLDDQKTGSLDDKIVEPESEKSEEKLVKVSKRGGEEESDRENRSVNESNSTGLSCRNIGEGEEELIKDEPEPVRSGEGGRGGGGPVESESKVSESEEELGDSVTQLSSDDVQSSASFGRRKRKRDSGDVEMKDKAIDVKSEPLIRILQMIRSHCKHASMFQRRLKSQESNHYKELIRQHVDLETIQTRVEGGSYYSSCILTFYRDLLLLFNNAIVYFPKASLEYETAHQLRNLVLNEIKKETQKSDSSQDDHQQIPPLPPQPQTSQLKPLLERSDSLFAKHKSSAPIIVCRKRSSVSAKQSSSLAQKVEQQQQQSDDTKKPATDIKPTVELSLLKVKTEEKKPLITGARSSRRSSRNLTSNTPPSSSNSKKQNGVQGSKGGSGSLEKQEATPKTEKKKNETSDKKKSVVDFLKRIKKNSPVQMGKKSSKGGNKPNGSEERKRNNTNSANGKNDNKSNEGKERLVLRSSEKKQAKGETSPSKKSAGRQAKKTAEVSKTSGKRGRESGGKENVVTKRQSKRARR